jgi:hypothetical protein
MLIDFITGGVTSRSKPLVLWAADNGGGSGGNTGSDNNANTDDENDDEEETDDEADDEDDDTDSDSDSNSSNDKQKLSIEQQVKQGVDNLIERFGGNARAAVTQLYREKYTLREQKRSLTRENNQLRQQLPGKGRTVVTAQEASQLAEYRKLGSTKDLRGKLERITTLEANETRRSREDLITKVAKVAGDWNPTVLKDVGSSLDYATETIRQDGKDVEVAYVVSNNGKTKTNIVDYAKEHWKHHMPSLTAKGDTDDKSNTKSGGGRTQGRGTTNAPRKIASQAGAVAPKQTGTQQGLSSRITARYSIPGQKQE